MQRLLMAAGLALLLSSGSALAQDGMDPQDEPTLPQDPTVPSQPQDQPPAVPQQPQDQGVGGPGDQQTQPSDQGMDGTVDQPSQPMDQGTGGTGMQQPQTTDQGTGGAGTQQPACSCPNCPYRQQQGMRGGMMGQGAGPMRFGARLGELANVTVEDTNQGAVIRLDAQNPEQVAEVRALARAIASTWEAMGYQPQPAQPQQPAQQ